MRFEIKGFIAKFRNTLERFYSAVMVMVGQKKMIHIAFDGERTAAIFEAQKAGVYTGKNIIVSDGRFKFLVTDKGFLVNPLKLNCKLKVKLPIFIDAEHAFLPVGYVSDGVYDPNNIYHFITNDFLPYMRVRDVFREDTPIIFFTPPIPYIVDLLKFFDVKWNLVSSSVKVGRLYVSTCGYSDHSQAHYPFVSKDDIVVAAECARALNSLLPTNKGAENKKFIFYIDRPKKRRSLKNDEILRRSPYLECVRLEDLSFTDQILLFKRARIIIATHGAALTNLLWTENTRVIEIVPRNNDGQEFGFGCYERLSSLLGLSYRKILGEKLLDGEFEVDTSKLNEIVYELECLTDCGVDNEI